VDVVNAWDFCGLGIDGCLTSLEHYGSSLFLFILYVAMVICIHFRGRSSILLLFWTNCPARVTSSHNVGTFQLGVTTHGRNVKCKWEAY
jgi:hypothetical protein